MKLIRDKIPMIMKQAGIKFEARIADNDEYKSLLEEKLHEEAREFMDEPSLEEAADIYEVFLTIIANWGFSIDDVVIQADFKREEKGSFNERVVLVKAGKTKPAAGGSRYSKHLFRKPNSDD